MSNDEDKKKIAIMGKNQNPDSEKADGFKYAQDISERIAIARKIEQQRHEEEYQMRREKEIIDLPFKIKEIEQIRREEEENRRRREEEKKRSDRKTNLLMHFIFFLIILGIVIWVSAWVDKQLSTAYGINIPFGWVILGVIVLFIVIECCTHL
jgi:uncharacterized membrane protein YcjF (UPF0283 family)